MLTRHVPDRFSGKRYMWFARMCIVATRKAIKAENEGRREWAEMWRTTAYSAREGYYEIRPDYDD